MQKNEAAFKEEELNGINNPGIKENYSDVRESI